MIAFKLLTAAPSSSSMVNSFFFTVFSWFLKLNSAAFFWSLANLFSYFETFFSVGLMLERGHYNSNGALGEDF